MWRAAARSDGALGVGSSRQRGHASSNEPNVIKTCKSVFRRQRAMKYNCANPYSSQDDTTAAPMHLLLPPLYSQLQKPTSRRADLPLKSKLYTPPSGVRQSRQKKRTSVYDHRKCPDQRLYSAPRHDNVDAVPIQIIIVVLERTVSMRDRVADERDRTVARSSRVQTPATRRGTESMHGRSIVQSRA